MRKVIIVDDENLAVEGLRQLVDWKSYGASVSDVAYDGLSALEKIKIHQPDIVFVDIRLPGMNGLDLVKAAKTVVPNAIFVIISGYDDFEYARAGIQLGVVDYLVKPVTTDKIEGVLKHVEDIINARIVFNQMQKENNGRRMGRLKDAVGDLLALPNVTEHELAFLESKYETNLRGMNNVLVCTAEIASVEALEQLESLLHESMIGRHASYLVYSTDPQCVILFWAQSDSYNTSEFKQRLQWICDTMKEYGFTYRMGMGRCQPSLCFIRHALDGARRALEYARFLDEDFVAIEDLEYDSSLPSSLVEDKNRLELDLRIGRYEDALRRVRRAVEVLISKKLSLDIFYHECLDLVYLSLRICRESGVEFNPDGEVFLPHIEIRRYIGAVAIAEWMVSVFEKVVEWLDQRKSMYRSRKVLEAKEYIESHYQESITLILLAERIGMYPTYFSLVFRKQMGITYIKYLNQVRLEHARLLVNSEQRLKDVYKKVGFTSRRYFSDKFKSYYGCTPKQYRILHWQSHIH